MQLIDTLPETVYRVCDLIGVITNRNGAKWRDQALTSLVAEVSFLGKNSLYICYQLFILFLESVTYMYVQFVKTDSRHISAVNGCSPTSHNGRHKKCTGMGKSACYAVRSSQTGS